jgi:hypothetical protein
MTHDCKYPFSKLQFGVVRVTFSVTVVQCHNVFSSVVTVSEVLYLDAFHVMLQF